MVNRLLRGLAAVLVMALLSSMLAVASAAASTVAVPSSASAAVAAPAPAAVAAAAAGSSSTFRSLTPTRLLDTRSGTGAPAGQLAAMGTLTLPITGLSGVPAKDVSAVVVNLTVTNPRAGGYLLAWPSGTSEPVVSNVNFNPGQTVPNSAVVPIGADGSIQLGNRSGGSADVIVDVTGYFLRDPSNNAFATVKPTRLLDTRNGTGAPARQVAAMGNLTLPIAGRAGVPAKDVTAVVVNLTITGPRAGGHLLAWPSGTSEPVVSNVNFNPGQTVPNLAVVPVGADGSIQLGNRSGAATDVLVDITGYFLRDSTNSTFTVLTPTRVLDTRSGTGAAMAQVPAMGSLKLPIAGRSGVPAKGIAAVVVNLTITNPHAGGYLLAWPTGTSEPAVSNVNFNPGQTIPNLAVVPVGADGSIQLGNRSGAPTDVIVDITGYLTATAARQLDWTDATGPGLPAQGSPTGVSCATSTFCMAVDGRGSALEFDETSWKKPVGVSPLKRLTSISCPSASFCMTVDISGNAIAYDGHSWGRPQPVMRSGRLSIVSCASSKFCVAIDEESRFMTFDGKGWTEPTAVGTNVQSLSCPSDSFCIMTDNEGNYLTFDSAGWSAPKSLTYDGMPGPGAVDVTCLSPSQCLAVTGFGAVRFDGANWSSAGSIAWPVRDVASLSCSSATNCVATDARGYSSTFDGDSWSTPTRIDEAANFPMVTGLLSCAPSRSVAFCIGMNSFGTSYRFSAGRWSASEVVDVSNGPAAVSCPSTDFCMSVEGQSGKANVFDGSSWTETTIGARTILGGQTTVSCTSLQFCITGDTMGRVFIFNGKTWSKPIALSGDPFVGVSCASATFCMAIDSSAKTFSYDGSTWMSGGDSFPTSGQRPAGISCTARTFCIVVGVSGKYTRFDGINWSPLTSLYPRVPNWPVDLGALSCVSSSFCILLGSGGRVMRYDGMSWYIQPSVTNVANFVSVSCTSEQMCVGVTTVYGTVYQFSGANLQASAVADAHAGFTSVSCATDGFCLAISAENHRSIVGR